MEDAKEIINKLDNKVTDLDTRVNLIDGKVNLIDGKVNTLESTLNQHITDYLEFSSKTSEQFSQVDSQLDMIKSKIIDRLRRYMFFL